MDTLGSVSSKLFDKIRSQFSEISLGDKDANVTSEPSQARFFNFDYVIDGKKFSNITLSLIDTNSLKVFYSRQLTQNMTDADKTEWYQFLRSLREFARRNLLTFEPRDITKSNLNTRDLKVHAENDRPYTRSELNESRLMYGTKTVSYEDVGNAKILIKHSKPIIDETERNARIRNIESIFVENSSGERFRLPKKSLTFARSIARHVSEGGNLYDNYGQYITEIFEEFSKLRAFKSSVRSQVFESDSEEFQMIEAAAEYQNKLGKILKRSATLRGYQHVKEEAAEYQNSEVLSEEDMNEIKEKFVKKIYKDNISNALPIVTKAYNMKKQSTTQFESWADSILETQLDSGNNIDKWADVLSSPLPLGAEAINAELAIENLLGEDTALLDQLYVMAEDDPTQDARETIVEWLIENHYNDIARLIPEDALFAYKSEASISDVDSEEDDTDLESSEDDIKLPVKADAEELTEISKETSYIKKDRVTESVDDMLTMLRNGMQRLDSENSGLDHDSRESLRQYHKTLRSHLMKGDTEGFENALEIFSAEQPDLYVLYLEESGIETWDHLQQILYTDYTHDPNADYRTMDYSKLPKISKDSQVNEGAMKELSQDLNSMSDSEFSKKYGNSKDHYKSVGFNANRLQTKKSGFKTGDLVYVAGYKGLGKIHSIKSYDDVRVSISAPNTTLKVVTSVDQLRPSSQVSESKYWGNENTNNYAELYSKLVPKSGKCETLEGELLRAASKIGHDYYNNGFANDWTGPLIFLQNNLPADMHEEFLILAPFALGVPADDFGMLNTANHVKSEKEIDQAIDSLTDKVVDYINSKNGEYTPNTVGDMHETDTDAVFGYGTEYHDDFEQYKDSFNDSDEETWNYYDGYTDDEDEDDEELEESKFDSRKSPVISKIKDIAIKFFGREPYSASRISGGSVYRMSIPINHELTQLYRHTLSKDVNPKDKKIMVNLKDQFMDALKQNNIDPSIVDVKYHIRTGIYASVQINISKANELSDVLSGNVDHNKQMFEDEFYPSKDNSEVESRKSEVWTEEKLNQLQSNLWDIDWIGDMYYLCHLYYVPRDNKYYAFLKNYETKHNITANFNIETGGGTPYPYDVEEGKIYTYQDVYCGGFSDRDEFIPGDPVVSEEVDTSVPRKNDNTFNYKLLSRLATDCDYFLGAGNRSEKHLWAGNVADQISKMKELWNSFPEDAKPEWLSMEDIEDYEQKMTGEEITESDNKPYGIRYKMFAGRDERIVTKERWFATEEQRDRFAEKIQDDGKFYEIDSYSSLNEYTNPETPIDTTVLDSISYKGKTLQLEEWATGERAITCGTKVLKTGDAREVSAVFDKLKSEQNLSESNGSKIISSWGIPQEEWSELENALVALTDKICNMTDEEYFNHVKDLHESGLDRPVILAVEKIINMCDKGSQVPEQMHNLLNALESAKNKYSTEPRAAVGLITNTLQSILRNV
jgi:hypothetical protein